MERVRKEIWRQGTKTNQINKLFVYLNNYCNLKCSYCFYHDNHKSKIDTRKFNKVLNIFLKISNTPSITILGGEPLLNMNDLIKIIKISNEKNIPITIFTNATKINKTYKKITEKYNIHTVVSIDGDKSTTDKSRKFRNTKRSVYNTVIKNLKDLDMIDKVSVNMVITPQNVNKLSNNLKHLHEIGFNSIGISLDYSSLWSNKDILTLKKEFKKVFIHYITLLNNHNPYKFINIYEIIEKIKNKNISPCSNLILASDGNLYPCDKILYTNVKKLKIDKRNILIERENFFKEMEKLGLKNTQGFCEIGPYLYLRYKKNFDNKRLLKRLNIIKKLNAEIENILTKYLKILIKIPLFRLIHNIDLK